MKALISTLQIPFKFCQFFLLLWSKCVQISTKTTIWFKMHYNFFKLLGNFSNSLSKILAFIYRQIQIHLNCSYKILIIIKFWTNTMTVKCAGKKFVILPKKFNVLLLFWQFSLISNIIKIHTQTHVILLLSIKKTLKISDKTHVNNLTFIFTF